MKNYYWLCVIALLVSEGCSNASRRNWEIVNKKDSVEYNASESELHEFGEISGQFLNNSYYGLSDKIASFINSHSNSPYNRELTLFLDKIKENQIQDSVTRYSLYRQGPSKYFMSLNLPRLDSISESDFTFNSSYKLNFLEIDKKTFKPEFYDNWYLSIQEMNNYKLVAVSSFNPCQIEIILYSVDREYNVNSKLVAYWGGCIVGPAGNFHYAGQIINETERKMVTKFNDDKTITVLEQTYYTLEDSLTKNVRREIGSENNKTYKLDSSGKFIMLLDKSFKKDYIDPLYNEPY